MKVSICVTTYNSEKTIRRTLDSVLSQTFNDYEVIIVDDYSTDNTVNIVSNEYCVRDKRFKLFVNTTNCKWPYIDSFNKSYEYASGELLFRLDHDDVLLPDFLECFVNYMDAHPDIDGCSGKLIFYENTRIIDINNIDKSRYEPHIIKNYDEWVSYFNNCPPAISHLAGYCDDVYLYHNPGSCLRKSFYDKHHPKCIHYMAGDTIFWLQVMALGGKLHIVDEYKIIYTGPNASSTWDYEKEVEEPACYQKYSNLQYYYIAYFTYIALTLYDDKHIVKNDVTVANVKEVMFNTAMYFKDCLVEEGNYDKVIEKYKIENII